jgi:CO/xanthine dehydrogenase Mo-binding subunit
MKLIGQGMDRTDGRLKVTGGAVYSAEHALPRLAHAVMVQSTIPSGRIADIDDAAARAMPGVLLVMTHLNAPRTTLWQDNSVQYNGQPVAVVVADTLEHAQDAARHLRLRYAAKPAVLSFRQAKANLRTPAGQPDSHRGDVAAGMRQAAATVDAVYTTPLESHNPMEPHATIAAWDGDTLTLYDSTQSIAGVRKAAAKAFDMAAENVQVVCPFVGGGFGSKGTAWSHVMLAAMAAKLAGSPVKLALDRTQMAGPVGARPMTEQHIRMGAAADGKLAAVIHDTISSTSFIDDFPELCTGVTRMLYDAASVQTTQRMATLNLGPPTFMRAPGEATGSFARVRARRAGVRAAARSNSIAAAKLRRTRSRQRLAMVQQIAARMLPRRRRTFRLVAPNCGTRIDARWSYSRRVGNGDGDLPRLPLACESVGHHPRRRNGVGMQRHARPGNRHVHRHDADRGRSAGHAGVKGHIRTGPHWPTGSTDLGGIADGGQCRPGRVRGRQSSAQQTDRDGGRRSGVAAVQPQPRYGNGR